MERQRCSTPICERLGELLEPTPALASWPNYFDLFNHWFTAGTQQRCGIHHVIALPCSCCHARTAHAQYWRDADCGQQRHQMLSGAKLSTGAPHTSTSTQIPLVSSHYHSRLDLIQPKCWRWIKEQLPNRDKCASRQHSDCKSYLLLFNTEIPNLHPNFISNFKINAVVN